MAEVIAPRRGRPRAVGGGVAGEGGASDHLPRRSRPAAAKGGGWYQPRQPAGSTASGRTKAPARTRRDRGLGFVSAALGCPPVVEGPPAARRPPQEVPLGGRHLHETRLTTTVHWTTSFLGVSVGGGPHPARSLGPPEPLRDRRVVPPGRADGSRASSAPPGVLSSRGATPAAPRRDGRRARGASTGHDSVSNPPSSVGNGEDGAIAAAGVPLGPGARRAAAKIKSDLWQQFLRDPPWIPGVPRGREGAVVMPREGRAR